MGEKEEGQDYAWEADDNVIWQTDRSDTRYHVDHVFGPIDTTRSIYETSFHSIIDKVVTGFNATVFAYGQTSSGKTHTMQGPREEPGVIPLAVEDVFRGIDNSPSREFLCRVSYMELYNEEVYDLLNPSKEKLPIHEDRDNKVYVAGLNEEIVHDAGSVLSYIALGNQYRHTAATRMNDRSSRSHTVFRMIVESRSRNDSEESVEAGAVLVSTLTLVDLAGSERISKTGSEGIRMKEGTSINKSLLTLGIVINQLACNAGAVSYRDSKLTRILQPSLGGNARTAILCNITPAECHVEESTNTLRFACRAKKVVNSCTQNEVLSDAALMKRQAKEIEQLKKRLQESGMIDVEEQICKMRNELLRSEHERELTQLRLQEAEEENEKYQRQLQMVSQIMLEKTDNPSTAAMASMRRRETWCPGENPEAPHTGIKRGSGGELPSTPPPGSKCSRGDDGIPLPLLPEDMALDTREGNVSRPTSLEMDEEMIADDPVAAHMLLLKQRKEKVVMAAELDTLRRLNEEKDNQIRNLQFDLKAIASARGSPGRTPLTEIKELEGSQSRKPKRRSSTADYPNKEVEKRNKMLCKALNDVMDIKENIEMQALNSLEEVVSTRKEIDCMKEMLASANLQSDRCQEELSAKDTMIEEAKHALECAQKELQEMRVKMDTADESMARANGELKNELVDCQKQIEELQMERDDIQLRLAAQESRLKNQGDTKREEKGRDMIHKDVDRLKKRTEDAEGKVRCLVREKADLVSERSGLQRQIKGMEKTLDQMTKELKRKESAFDKRREHLANDQGKLKDKCIEQEKKLKLMKSEVDQKELNLKGWEEKASQFKKQLDDAAKEINRMHQLHSAVKSELEACEEDLEEFKAREIQSNDTILRLQNELVDSKAAGDDLSRMLADSIEANKKSSEESAEQLFEISRLKLMLEEFEDREERLSRDMLVKIENVQKEFSVDREELTAQIKKAEELHTKSTADMARKCVETEALNQKIAELRTAAGVQCRDLESQIKSAVDTNESLESAVASKDAEIQQLASKMTELEENLAGAKKRIFVLIDKEAKYTWTCKKELQEQKEEFSEKLQSANSELSTLREQLEQATAASQDRDAEYKEMIGRRDQQIENLDAQVNLLSGNRASLSNEANILTAECEKARSEAAQIRAELGEEIRKLSSALAFNEDELSHQRKEYQTLQEMVCSIKKETEEEYRVKMEEQKNDLLHELERLAHKIHEQEEQLKECDNFKELAKRKMIEERGKNSELVEYYESKLKSLQQENGNLSYATDRACKELEGWKSLQKGDMNKDLWIGKLVEEVHSLQNHVREFESTFNSNSLHMPTVQALQADMDRLREISMTSKKARDELQGVLNALRKDLTDCGFDPLKFDEKLEATRMDYQADYMKGKNKRLEEKLRKMVARVSELEAQQKLSVKSVHLSVDTSKPPPSSLGTPKERFWA